MDLGMNNQVAVITGASGGIGSGTARVFAGEGVNLVLNYHANRERAEKLAKDLHRTYGVQTLAIQADVGKEEDVVRLFQAALEEFGTVDILINNAAPTSHAFKLFSGIREMDVAALHLSESVIIDALFTGCREFIKILHEQHKGGHIVNVLSKSAFWSSSIGNTIYASCKGAADAFTKALAHEVAYDGIYVNAIIPGYVRNNAFDESSERYKRTIEVIPSGRYGEPEDMGHIIAFLCSNLSNQINGASIDCTGGTMNGDFIPPERRF